MKRTIIYIEFSYIYSSTIAHITIDVAEQGIILTLPKERIYRIKDYKDLMINSNTVSILCSQQTSIDIYASFIEILGAFYFPFISSDFRLNFQIKKLSHQSISIHILLNQDLTMLNEYSFIIDNGKKLKRREIWGEKNRHYYYLLSDETKNHDITVKFRARSGVKNFIYGIAPLFLPMLMSVIGLIILFSKNLPDSIQSPALYFGILVGFTPFFMNLWFNTKIFMSWNLGTTLYIFSYSWSIVLVGLYALFISLKLDKIFQASLFLLTLLFVITFLFSLRRYYALGEFNKIAQILLNILLKLPKMIYRTAHKLQRTNIVNNSS